MSIVLDLIGCHDRLKIVMIFLKIFLSRNNVKAELRLIVTNRCQASSSSSQRHHNNVPHVSPLPEQQQQPLQRQNTSLMSPTPTRMDNTRLLHSSPYELNPAVASTRCLPPSTDHIQPMTSLYEDADFLSPPPPAYLRNGLVGDIRRPPPYISTPHPYDAPTSELGEEDDTHIPDDVIDYVCKSIFAS